MSDGRTRRLSGCPIDYALDLFGDRWTLLVIRDLSRGHEKFGDLLRELRGISPAVLSDRLQKLEAHGLVTRTFYSDHPPRARYLLTDKGDALAPTLRALIAWGNQHAPRKPRARASA